jgi:uracil-DNA glycosylase
VSGQDGLRAILDFYLEAGVDALLGETAVDRFVAEPLSQPRGLLGSGAQHVPEWTDSPPVEDAGLAQPASPANPDRRPPAARRQPATVTSVAAAKAPEVPLAPEAALMAARDAARSAPDLEALRAILDHFEGCTLRFTANRLVFADGNPQGRVMFVGEAPGREEDLEGLPFVGRSGQLLDRIMAAIGLDRSTAYIANVIPWRPPGNRSPTPQETQICLPFIKRQVELADPDVLVCLGGPSASALLGVIEGVRKARGRWHVYHTGTREIRAIATFHPAYLLRTPLEKRFVWRDFLAIKKALEQQRSV